MNMIKINTVQFIVTGFVIPQPVTWMQEHLKEGVNEAVPQQVQIQLMI